MLGEPQVARDAGPTSPLAWASRWVPSHATRVALLAGMTSREHDRRELPPVIRLAAMGGAAVGIEILLQRAGAGGNRVHVLHARRTQAVRGVAREIELPVPFAPAMCEKRRCRRIGRHKTRLEFGPNLVGRLAD